MFCLPKKDPRWSSPHPGGDATLLAKDPLLTAYQLLESAILEDVLPSVRGYEVVPKWEGCETPCRVEGMSVPPFCSCMVLLPHCLSSLGCDDLPGLVGSCPELNEWPSIPTHWCAEMSRVAPKGLWPMYHWASLPNLSWRRLLWSVASAEHAQLKTFHGIGWLVPPAEGSQKSSCNRYLTHQICLLTVARP